MHGIIDYLTNEHVGGWVLDLDDPAPVQLSIMWADNQVARGVADRLRPDIESMFGRAATGFLVPLPAGIGYSNQEALAKLGVLASLAGESLPILWWDDLRHRIEAGAEDERREAHFATLPANEAVAFLLSRMSSFEPWGQANIIATLLGQRQDLPDDADLMLLKGYVAFEQERPTECMAVLEPLPRLAAGTLKLEHDQLAWTLRLRAAYAVDALDEAGLAMAGMAARGYQPDRTLAAAIHAKMTRPRVQLPALAHGAYSITLTRDFKWGSPRFPQWGAVFTGTTDDTVEKLDAIVRLVEAVPAGERQLVTIIGGMWFLRLLGRLEFARIMTFDSNVMELAKMRWRGITSWRVLSPSSMALGFWTSISATISATSTCPRPCQPS
jgi:hypothetical protein